jgi:hypothetical protein
MRSSAIFVAFAAAAVSAQTVPTYKSALNMTIDPNTVPQQQRGKPFCLLLFSSAYFFYLFLRRNAFHGRLVRGAVFLLSLLAAISTINSVANFTRVSSCLVPGPDQHLPGPLRQ